MPFLFESHFVQDYHAPLNFPVICRRVVALCILMHPGLAAYRLPAQVPTAPPSTLSSGNSSTSPARMIPFDPNDDRVYRAVDLPPPSASSSGATAPLKSPVVPLSPGLPLSPSQLPGATQLLPKDAAVIAPISPNAQPTNAPDSNPPIPDLTAFNSDSGPQGVPMATEAAANRMGGSGSLISFQPKSNPELETKTIDFEASQLLAIVGTERILAGDLAALVEPVIHENRDRITSPSQEQVVRQSLTRQALPQYIELKAMCQEYFRDMAGNAPPDELKKMQEQVMVRASKMFYERYVPVELFKRHEVEDLAELDQKLRETGLSLAIMKNHFLTQVLASQLEDKYVATTYEIPPQEILDYYQQHISKWQIPARAKWRQLTVRLDRHTSQEEAENLIRSMGDEVVLGGKPFEAVARDSSEGFTASQGGLHDWTFEGSLKSSKLNEAIFSLPLNRLSNVIQDEVGYHIIEVVQRESARTKDMAEIQTEIRKTLSKQRQQVEAEKFRERVLDRVIVWTRWPEDMPGSRALAEALGEMAP